MPGTSMEMAAPGYGVLIQRYIVQLARNAFCVCVYCMNSTQERRRLALGHRHIRLRIDATTDRGTNRRALRAALTAADRANGGTNRGAVGAALGDTELRAHGGAGRATD